MKIVQHRLADPGPESQPVTLCFTVVPTGRRGATVGPEGDSDVEDVGLQPKALLSQDDSAVRVEKSTDLNSDLSEFLSGRTSG